MNPFRLIVLDTKLEVKKALGALLLNGVVSAPLWDSDTSSFAGMFTVADIIHLIQYYYHTSSYDNAAADVEHFRLESLRRIERELKVPTPPTQSVHPLKPLYEACRLLIQTHARRLPLLDYDEQTGGQVVLSVLTQYRVLKFIAINCRDIINLHMSLRTLGIGTYVDPNSSNPFHPIATATLNTRVFDVVHMFSERGIIRLGEYKSLDLTIAAALAHRAPDFPGVITCTPSDSLASLLALVRQRRVHRLVVVEGEDGRKGRLAGIITLSDVLKYVVGEDVDSASPQSAPAQQLGNELSQQSSPALSEVYTGLQQLKCVKNRNTTYTSVIYTTPAGFLRLILSNSHQSTGPRRCQDRPGTKFPSPRFASKAGLIHVSEAWAPCADVASKTWMSVSTRQTSHNLAGNRLDVDTKQTQPPVPLLPMAATDN
ncbi:snf1p protein kinase activator [Rhizoctonia solani AG-1 IA]|uniref:Snf1p protein kinase activator n=1 Tax=Thanatephorus cucumeris (strain AG1-IA) TaxID=983506 RepID=L8WUL8_THACA|nr:snf1p protein kinase activator [Rhizoctonia solani AG-1 IA]